MVFHGDYHMRLAKWLTENGVSNPDFGKRIDRSAEAVRRYANGERVPDREAMIAIDRETSGQVTPNDFFGIKTRPTPAQQAAA